MTLEATNEKATREEFGYSFPMRISGSVRSMRVCVSEDALVVKSPAQDETELQDRLYEDRAALEAVAREKYDRGRVSADGKILITATDALSLIE